MYIAALLLITIPICSLAAAFFLKKRAVNISQRAFILFSVIFSIIALYHMIMRYVSHFLWYDFGLFSNIMRNGINGNFFYNSIEGWFDHFSGLLFIFYGIFFIFRHPFFLLIIKAAALFSGVFIFYKIAVLNVAEEHARKITLLLILNPVLFFVFQYDFQMLSFLFPAYALALYGLEKQCTKTLYTGMFFTMITREEGAILCFFLGLYAYLENKMDLKKSLRVMIFSACYFIAAMKILSAIHYYNDIPLFQQNSYAYLGKSFSEIVCNIFLSPQLWLEKIISFNNIVLLMWYALPFFLIPLLYVKGIILFAPVLFLYMLTSIQPAHTVFYQYASPILPGLFFCFIKGCSALKKEYFYTAFVFNSVLIHVCLSASPLSLCYHHPDYNTILQFQNSYYRKFYSVDETTGGYAPLLKMIPDTASLSMHAPILSRTTRYKNIYCYPITKDTDYILVNAMIPQYDKTTKKMVHRINYPLISELKKSHTIVNENRGYLLLKKRDPVETHGDNGNEK